MSRLLHLLLFVPLALLLAGVSLGSWSFGSSSGGPPGPLLQLYCWLPAVLLVFGLVGSATRRGSAPARIGLTALSIPTLVAFVYANQPLREAGSGFWLPLLGLSVPMFVSLVLYVSRPSSHAVRAAGGTGGSSES